VSSIVQQPPPDAFAPATPAPEVTGRSVDLTAHDAKAIRKVLCGGSIVDWRRFEFADQDEVERFLRVMGIRPDSKSDAQRLLRVQRRAASYLTDTFGFDIPKQLARPKDVFSAFLQASGPNGPEQRLAGAVVKAMHIIHRLDARELWHRLSISDQELFDRVEGRVTQAVGDAGSRGINVIRLDLSRKDQASILTKLLSKRTALAAQIFDRLRFRVVTAGRDDLLPLIKHLTRTLFPFNYVVPDESRNDLIDLDALSVADGPPGSPASSDAPGGVQNEFSGKSYRMLAFVADVPVRVDEFLAGRHRLYREHGAVIYVSTEFQIYDQATEASNEEGDGSHDAYKSRQRAGVLKRLITPGKG
jgi:uncharacterized protein (TIGR04552 family)